MTRLILSQHEALAASRGELKMVVRPVKDLSPRAKMFAFDGQFASFTDGNGYRAPFRIGQQVWLAETWRRWDGDLCGCGGDVCHCPPDGTPIYAANFGPRNEMTYEEYGPWRSPATMPRAASRFTMTVTSVKCKKLTELTHIDLRAMPYQHDGDLALVAYQEDWNNRYGNRYPWGTAWAWLVGLGE